MTAEFESMASLLLVILTILCVVQLVFLGLLLWYLKKMADLLRGRVSSATPLPEPAPAPVTPSDDGGPEVASPPAPPVVPPAREAPGVPASWPAEIIGDSPDIQASIARLAEKHGLKDVIIATQDGLVVVSLLPGSSDDAARFSDLYRRKRKPDVPGVTFLEILHRGEPMLAILRSERPLAPDQVKGIDVDARKILNWWL